MKVSNAKEFNQALKYRRQITQESIIAFLKRRTLYKANMVIQPETDGRHFMYLHGNRIAMLTADDKIMICDGGWQTNTTKERLNGLPGVSIQQKNFVWYLNGQPWNGAWIEISSYNKKD